MRTYRRAPRTALERLGRLPYRSNRRPVTRGDYLARRAPAPRRTSRQAVMPYARLEKKGMDTSIDLPTIISTTNTNAYAVVLNLIQPGTGSWNRVGKKTHLKSLRLTGCINFALTPTFATGALNSTFVRMLVVWDTQPSGGAIPTFDTIFGITAQDGTESCPDITCPVKYDNMDRFRVLRDFSIAVPTGPLVSQGTGPYLAIPARFDEYIKLANLESVYSGQTNPMTIADISTGGLYFYARSLTNLATCTANVDGIARLRYTE